MNLLQSYPLLTIVKSILCAEKIKEYRPTAKNCVKDINWHESTSATVENLVFSRKEGFRKHGMPAGIQIGGLLVLTLLVQKHDTL